MGREMVRAYISTPMEISSKGNGKAILNKWENIPLKQVKFFKVDSKKVKWSLELCIILMVKGMKDSLKREKDMESELTLIRMVK